MVEKITFHIMWVWGQEEGFMKRGKEGMLVITDNRIAFIVKTRMKYRVHQDYSLRQLKRFRQGDYDLAAIDSYKEVDLQNDLADSDKNIDIPFENVVSISQEKKRWGTVLKLKFLENNSTKSYKFMAASGWVKYPLKDPISFHHIDWSPIIILSKRFENH
jgi:hypothetical protein